jgi:hypothetical protein
MKKVMNETEAYRNLLLSMLTHNGYYVMIRKWAKNQNIDLEKAASMFNVIWDDIPDGMSAYYYLDSVEDLLAELKNKHTWKELCEMFTDAYDFRDYLYDHYMWKESY